MSPTRVGLFSPYIPKHAGGGEKHLLATAAYLSQKKTPHSEHQMAYDVQVLIPTASANQISAAATRYEQLFNLDLSRITWQPSLLADRQGSAWDHWRLTRQFDIFFYLTDGSLFFSGAPRSILHIQIPFQHQQKGFINRLKLYSWPIKNANSQFTRQIVSKAWQTKIPFCHYPYVDLNQTQFTPEKKKPQIVAVGRFYATNQAAGHSKRQDAMIKTFITGCRTQHWDDHWELHLVGTIEPGAAHAAYTAQLHAAAQGYPIFFHHDINHAQLLARYQQASIFWHLAGLDVAVERHPELVEHFGMTTIEAMAHGVIPVVVDKGGLRETVDHGQNGFRFLDLNELQTYTQHLMSLAPAQRRPLQEAARAKAAQFSYDRFTHTIDDMIAAARWPLRLPISGLTLDQAESNNTHQNNNGRSEQK